MMPLSSEDRMMSQQADLSATALSTSQAVVAIKISEEQRSALKLAADRATGNMMVEALAGAGKTWWIVKALGVVSGRSIVVSFNDKIATEIKNRIAKGNFRNAQGATFHSVGGRILSALYPKAMVEGKGRSGKKGFGLKKMTYMLRQLDKAAESLPAGSQIPDHMKPVPEYLKGFVRRCVPMAMCQGIGIEGIASAKDINVWKQMIAHYRLDSSIANDHLQTGIDLHGTRDELILEGIRQSYKLLNLSKKLLDTVISFDDMLYMPLLLKAPFTDFTFNNVFVDEAQDSNPLRVEFANRMCAPGGRLFFVGDKNQSIYGFTGAMPEAMDIIRKRFNCTVAKLTTSFRCSKAIARKVSTMRGPNGELLVPDFKAAENALEGSTSMISEEEFNETELRPGMGSEGDAIICRTTRPLVELAFNLIRRGIPCHVEGKDVGQNLVSQIGFIDDRIKTIATFEKKMDVYLKDELAKLKDSDDESEAEAITDKIETLRTVMHAMPAGSNMEDVKVKIASLFGDKGDDVRNPTVALMTVHKSKGLEFDRVFGWGEAQLMPSTRAIAPHEVLQEYNLLYVLYTRGITSYTAVNANFEQKKKAA